MVFVGTLGFFDAKNTLEKIRMAELTNIAEFKVKMIAEFFADRKKDILVVQGNSGIKRRAALLSNFSGKQSDPIYQTIKNELDGVLKGFQLVYNYLNILLINSVGEIVYAFDKSGASKYSGNHLPDPFRKAFEEGKNKVYFSDIFISPTVADQFLMLVTAPVKSLDGEFVGVIAHEISMAPIYNLIQETTGLGRTGETLIARKAGDKALFLNPLRHDSTAALKRTVIFGERHATPIQEALTGNDGFGLSVDYRGKEVIAAWRHIAALDWGMVAKIDVAEAFEPVTDLKIFFFILAIAVIVLAFLAALIVAKSISEPIQILQKGTAEIGSGKLDYKVGTDAKDEIAQLGRAFDQMAEKLKTVTASRDELNREINERKRAQKALQLTRFCIDHVNEMLYWVDPEGKIVDVNDASCNNLGYSREELVSMGVEDIDPYTPIKEYDQIWQDLKKRRTSKMETVYYAKNGEPIPVEMTFNHITFDGKEYNCVFAHDISARKQAEEELQKSMSELDERIKELNCLFEISKLVEKRELTLDDLLEGIIGLIPPAWQFPDITCAKIEVNGKALKTQNFRETNWQLVSDISVHRMPNGKLVVGYLEDRPERDEGPFLKEERALVDAIAERVGRIIERRWAQDALRKSEEKYRELMENMHSGVAVYEAVARGENFEFKDFNRSGEIIEKINREEVIGHLVTDVFPGVRDLGIFDVFQRVWKTGNPEYFSGGIYQDHRLSPSWRESYVYKLSSGEIVAVYQDVTEQKLAQKALEESEKRFRDLVENSLTGISIVQDDRVVYQNRAQERLLGPLPRSYLLADFEKIHSDDVEVVKRLSQRMDQGEIQTLETDFQFYADGPQKEGKSLKWVYCRALLTEYKGKDAILVNMIDMTRSKELELMLAIQDKMASLGRVAAGMAHEIRNPLSGINIYLNTLKKLHHKEGSEEKIKQIIRQIQSASQKIETVIRRVMDFAKPGEPRLTLIDINRPVTEAIKLSAVTMRKNGIELEKALTERLPPCNADPTLIEEMVLNLLNNAAGAMKTMAADKKIVVTSSVVDNGIVLTVSDSGPGIASEIKNKIFDPFFTTKSDGTGIGLSISHRIVTDHGGSLTVSDSDLGGAEFRIEIPIKG
jgi:PAS domain S-box-containing protein